MKINIDEKTIEAWIDYMEKFEPLSAILIAIRRDRLKRVGTEK